MNVIMFFAFYLFGSINFAYWLGKLRGLDISKFFDGNLGAYNLYRTSNSLALAALAGVLDIIKVYLPAKLFGIWAGIAAYLGHAFSIISMIATGRVGVTAMGSSSVAAILLAVYPEAFIIWSLLMIIHFTVLTKFLFPSEVKIIGNPLYHAVYALLAIVFYLGIKDHPGLVALSFLLSAAFFLRWRHFVVTQLLKAMNKQKIKELIDKKRGFAG